jgi:glycosyltransferase involved in cell wall biosynthesis
MTKIGFVHSVSVVGGAERMSQAIMEGLPKYNFESQLFCPSVGEFPESLQTMNINSSYIEMFQPSIKHPIRSIKHYLKWRRLIRSEKIDILHTGDLICARSLLKAANSLNIPVICHMHFPVQEDFVSWVFKGLPKPFGFVFCSQELQNDVGELLQKYCPDTKQWVVHNGVDVENFSHPYSENTTPQIGIIANLQQRKGHDDFLQMASLLKEQGVVASYEIIGGDILQEPREPYLKNKTKELGLEHCVNFHGQVNNVQALLNQLDIFVCASHQEAFPVSILEAMASTKAIVSTNVNGIPEAIVDGESGILVKAHEPEQLAKAVKSLIDDPSYRKTLAINARERVVDKFSNTVYLESIIDIYNQALSQ